MNKHIRKLVIAVMLVMTAVLCCGMTNAEAARTSARTVRLGYMWGMNFQEGAAEGERKYGYSYDYLQQVAAYSGWRYEYVYGSWEELFQKLEKGEIDIMAGISYTPERAEKLGFPDMPMTMENYYIFVRKQNDLDYPDISSLEGKTVGVSKDTLTYESLKRWAGGSSNNIRIVEYADDDARIEAFRRGETDATADLDMQVSADDGMVPVVQFGASNTYFAVAKKRPDLLRELNAAMGMIHTTIPTYESKLYQKYFSETAALSSLTAEEFAWFAEHPVIHAGYLEHMAPFTETGDNGEARGMYMDLLRFSFQRMGLSNTVEFHPYSGVEDMRRDLEMGKIDLAVPLYASLWLSEQNNLLQSIDVLSAQMYFVSPASTVITKNTAFAVADTIPVQARYLEKFYPDNHVVHYESMEAVVRALRSGKADAAVMNSFLMSIYMRNEPDMQRAELKDTEDLSIAVNRRNMPLLNVINRGITAWGPAAVHDSLLRHTDEEYVPTFMEYVQTHAFSFMAAVLFASILLTAGGAFLYFRDKQRKEAERAAHVDDMTGLMNRRAYEELLAQYENTGLPKDLVVISVDINGLKAANDTQGHAAGDEMIRGVADCIRKAASDPRFEGRELRSFRTGGDEFIVLMRASDEEYVRSQELFFEILAEWRGSVVERLACSVGYVLAEEYPEASVTELLRIADDRMYLDKEKKRRSCGGRRHRQAPLTGVLKADIDRDDAELMNTFLQVLETDYDEMTGLPGMYYFLRSVPSLKEDILAHGGSPAVVHLQLAGMPAFNDIYGLQAGDELIVTFATLLSKLFGKKHCALLSGSNIFLCTSDRMLEERLEQLFVSMRHVHGGELISVRAGIYVMKQEDDISAAKACDLAKIAGRRLTQAVGSEFAYYTR